MPFNCETPGSSPACEPSDRVQRICYADNGDQFCRSRGWRRTVTSSDCSQVVTYHEDDNGAVGADITAQFDDENGGTFRTVPCPEVVALDCNSLEAMGDVTLTVDNLDLDETTLANAIAAALAGEVLTVDPGANFTALIDGAAAAITAQLQANLAALQAEFQALCDKLTDGSVIVQAQQSGTWQVTVEPSQIQAIIDGIVNGLQGQEVNLSAQNIADLVAAIENATLNVVGSVTVTGGTIDIGSMPDVTLGNIAELIAALEAATLTVTGDVNVTGGSIEISGLAQAAIDDLIAALEAAALTVTVDSGNITVDGTVNLGNIPDLVAALDSLNVSIDNIPDLVAALEAATLTVSGTTDIGNIPDLVAALDGLNISIDNIPELVAALEAATLTTQITGTVDIDGYQDLLDAFASLEAVINAGLDINTLPEVTLTADTIADLVAALEAATLNVDLGGQNVNVTVAGGEISLSADTLAALENITVTVDTTGGPIDVTGTVQVTVDPANPITVTFDPTALTDLADAIAAANALALDSMNVTVDNFADLVPLLQGLQVTVNGVVQTQLDATQLQALLEHDPTDDDVRVVENYVAEHCLNGQTVFTVVKASFAGDPDNAIADARVVAGYWHAGSFSATLPAGAVPGACAQAVSKQAIALPQVCLDVDGVAMLGTAVMKYDPEADAYEAPEYFDGAGMLIGGTVTLNDDQCACEAECVVAIPENPSLQLVKVVDSVEPYGVGDDITGHFEVTNTGNVPLSNVTIVDADPAVTVSGSPIASLGVGETHTSVTWSYTLTAADLLAGSYQNQATATGSSPGGVQASDLSSTETNPTGDDPTIVTLEQPAIQIVKEVTSTGPYALGDTISGTFSVTNIGDVILSNVTVTDLNATVTGGTIGTLVVGETNSTATWSHVVTQPDLDLGEYQNQATADGTSPAGTVVSDLSSVAANPTGDDPNVVDIDQTLDAQLLKQGVLVSGSLVGDTVSYKFTLINTGNVTITDAPLVDPVLGIAAGQESFAVPIAPGAAATIVYSYALTEADRDAGEIINTATATISDDSGNGPVDVDSTNTLANPDGTPTVTDIPNIQDAAVETSTCGPEILGVTAETVGCVPASNDPSPPAGSDPSNLVGEMRNSLTNQTSGDSLTPGSTYGFSLGVTNTDAAPFVGPYLLRFSASCPEVAFTGNVSNAPSGSTVTLIDAQTLELSIQTDIAPGGPPPGLIIGAPGPEWVLAAGAAPGLACAIQATVNGSPLSGSANYAFTVAGGAPGGGGGAGDPGFGGGAGDPGFFPDSDGDGVEDDFDADPFDPAIQ